MSSTDLPITPDYPPVFDLCDVREKRFLCDLMATEPRVVHDHPLPELHALLLALERMWGGHHEKPPMISPHLLYYLVVYATHAHHIHEDVEGWRRGGGHEVHAILQGCMETVAWAIKDGSEITHADDGVYIDLFRIPRWFYEETMHRHTTARLPSPRKQ